MTTPPLVVALVDAPRWAHDLKTRQLTRALRSSFRVRAVYQDEAKAEDLAGADLVLLYYWLQWSSIPRLHATLERMRSRVVIGVCSHWELAGERREPGLTRLNESASAVFLNNLALYRDYRSVLAPRAFYTPNGVDVDFFRPASCRRPARAFRVGWAGSLGNFGRQLRGYDEYILPAVRQVPGAELVTAVREERWRTREQMRRFYRSLDAYICASESEGTPNPCLEAAACGVPIVTTAVGNMPEFVEDGVNGFLVARDVDEFRDRLCRLAASPDLASSMGRRARAAAERWDWRRRASRYASMFRFCLERARCAPLPAAVSVPALEAARRFRTEAARLRRARTAFYIWGAGSGGRLVLGKLAAAGLEVDGFVDNDPAKRGNLVDGRPVVHPDDLDARSDLGIVVASQHAAAIRAQLIESGRRERRDFLVAPLDRLLAEG